MMPCSNILVFAAENELAVILHTLRGEGYLASGTHIYTDLVDQLNQQTFGLVLIAITPWESVLASLQEQYPQIPVILLIPDLEVRTAIQGIKAGATDCLDRNKLTDLGSMLRSLGLDQPLDQIKIKPPNNKPANNEDYFYSLIQNLTIGVMIQGPQAEILVSNPAATRLLGLTEDQLLGKTSFDPDWIVLHEDGSPFAASEHPVPQVIATGKAVHNVIMGVYHPLEQDFIWLSVNADPHLDKDNKVQQVICTFSDIGTLKKEEILRRKALEERLVRENMEFQNTERLKINQLKDVFLSTVSHELRTPISNIRMAIHMLKKQSLTSKQSSYVKILDQECSREIELINDLLEVQKLESGSRMFYPEEIVLEPWIADLVDSFEERILEKKQSLEFKIDPHLPTLITDRGALERIITELLNNACKYTPEGEWINLYFGKLDDKFVQILVTNSGVEIPETEIPSVFDKFYRIPVLDLWQQPGTGLGLSLVQELVSLLRGTIKVQSAENITNFTILIPCLTLESL